MKDQDFFFDEDEEQAPPAKDSSQSGAQAETAARTSRARPASAPPAFFETNVSMMVASLMTVIGLLAGGIVGFIIAPDVPAPSAVHDHGPAGGGVAAPQLTPEQLESGQMPANHPPVGEMGGSQTTTPTGSPEATGTEGAN